MLARGAVLLIFVSIILQCYGEFVIPEVTLEAYEPKGFRASIPALEGIQMFAFHGNVNKEITQIDPGQFSKDFTSPSDNNMWSYFNDELSLKVGDVVYYWIFIQYDKLGYRKDAQRWNVTELLKIRDSTCETSKTVVARKSLICKNSVIFQDNFDSSAIDGNKWLIEEYIPYHSPNYEFVSYQNRPDVCYVNDNKLFIKPKYAQSENEIRGELDLRNGCTRQTNDECYFKQETVFIIPPVTSARLVSQVNFRYGKIEIKAKLPGGDWIYPQIYLEQVSHPNKKLFIAYARGNNELLAHSNEDIGSRLLFGGPVLQPQEPSRSTYLKTTRSNNPFSSQTHVYTVIWSKDRISLQVDGNQYGEIDKRTMQEIRFGENEMVRLVLGVGVGGVNDFPDDFRSGGDVKPWHNKDRTQVRSFFDARNNWSKTWAGDKSTLQVEYVKISAL